MAPTQPDYKHCGFPSVAFCRRAWALSSGAGSGRRVTFGPGGRVLDDWLGQRARIARWYAMSLGKRLVLDFAKWVGWQAGGAQAYARSTIAGHHEETPHADH